MKATRVCSIPDCEGRHVAHGYCRAHYSRWYRHEDVTAGPVRRGRSVCQVTCCARPVKGDGMCEKHRRRMLKHGDPLSDGRLRHADHPNWVGNDASYRQAHARMQAWRGLASAHQCMCGAQAAEWAYDHADTAEQLDPDGRPYSTDPARYSPKCRPCHRTADARRHTVAPIL